MAEENGYKNSNTIYKALQIRKRESFNPSIISSDDLQNNGLVQKLGHRIAAKCNFIIQTIGTYRRIYNVEIYGNSFPYYLLNKKCVKLCPLCMLEQRYIRNVWNFIPITTCYNHQCLLIDHCPICNISFRWHDDLLNKCTNCSTSWEQITEQGTTLLTAKDIELAKLLCAKIGLQESTEKSLYLDTLGMLNFVDLSALLSLIAWVLPSEKAFWNMNYIEQEENKTTHKLLMKALDVFDDWPNNFHKFLFSLQSETKYYSKRQRGKVINKENVPGIYRSLFGDFYTKLHEELSSEAFSFIREALEKFMTEHWKNAFVKQYRKIDFYNSKRVYYTSKDVLERYGMRGSVFKKYVKMGLFEGFDTISNKKKVTLATKESVDAFMKMHKESLSSLEAAKLLGINDETLLADLHKRGCIIAVRGPGIDGSSHWRFDEDSLISVLKSFEDNTMLKDIALEETISFGKTAKSIQGRYYPSYVEVIQKVQNGILQPCGLDIEQVGLNKFLFSKKDIYMAFQQELNNVKSDLYSLVETAKVFQMNRNKLSYLLKQGYLEHTIEQSGYIKIKQQAITNFKENYILLGKLQTYTGKSAVALLTFLKENGFLPVNGDKNDERHQYLFKQSTKFNEFLYETFGIKL